MCSGFHFVWSSTRDVSAGEGAAGACGRTWTPFSALVALNVLNDMVRFEIALLTIFAYWASPPPSVVMLLLTLPSSDDALLVVLFHTAPLVSTGHHPAAGVGRHLDRCNRCFMTPLCGVSSSASDVLDSFPRPLVAAARKGCQCRNGTGNAPDDRGDATQPVALWRTDASASDRLLPSSSHATSQKHVRRSGTGERREIRQEKEEDGCRQHQGAGGRQDQGRARPALSSPPLYSANDPRWMALLLLFWRLCQSTVEHPDWLLQYHLVTDRGSANPLSHASIGYCCIIVWSQIETKALQERCCWEAPTPGTVQVVSWGVWSRNGCKKATAQMTVQERQSYDFLCTKIESKVQIHRSFVPGSG